MLITFPFSLNFCDISKGFFLLLFFFFLTLFTHAYAFVVSKDAFHCQKLLLEHSENPYDQNHDFERERLSGDVVKLPNQNNV